MLGLEAVYDEALALPYPETRLLEAWLPDGGLLRQQKGYQGIQ